MIISNTDNSTSIVEPSSLGLVLPLIALAGLLFFILPSCTPSTSIDYSTQVKPILNKHCLSCHGGVKKQGGFSLLFEDEALAKLPSGRYGIVPGKTGRSEMIKRLTHEDLELRMPFEAPPLSKEEIDILTQWVDQGAKWGEHWAYIPLEPVAVPAVQNAKHPIDAFVQDKLTTTELSMSEEASATTLARRAALDIIGMMPPGDITATYLSDPSSTGYEAYVDSLLASPHYGEKWTSMWLDLARYADTKGYERDDKRQIWRYRDWLISAFNDDMPYDQFITEQLAGDLLPAPTDDQYIATAFHRNTMTNDEGGTDNEEYRIAAVIDRVNTTWEALMSTSFACIQCHSHPYDPFTHEEYYNFLAFFNNTRDEDTYGDYPVLRHYNHRQLELIDTITSWVAEEQGASQAEEIRTFLKTLTPARNSLTTDQFVNAELADTKWLSLRNNSIARLANVNLDGKDQLLFRYRRATPNGTLEIHTGAPDGPVIGTWQAESKASWSWSEVAVDIDPKTGTHDIYFTYSNPSVTDPDKPLLLFDWFYFSKKLPDEGLAAPSLQDSFYNLLSANVPTTPIMIDNPDDLRRTTNIYERGSWLSLGDEVAPGVPGIFQKEGTSNPTDRLQLADWMTSPDHPLTARTIVNRIWEQLYGTGLVETMEDIGTQGAPAVQQELLDYLAYELIHTYDWSLKRLVKEIVMSDTYRQRSDVTPAHIEIDPLNQYYARMSRVRLSAEQLRDQALTISNTLNDTMYGPPVMPYQPDGIWSSPYDGNSWSVATDNDRYRRAVYIYWKRTSPYPSMITFDGVGREVCSSRRIRTNTPLQALVTLNDEVYIDLSKKLVSTIWGDDIDTMISRAYERATLQEITSDRLAALSNLYDEALQSYTMDRKLAIEITDDITTDDPLKYAAMTLVANAILNLDEVITKT